MKTAISLPDVLFEKAERLANAMGISRSQLYARALGEYIERHSQDTITSTLDELYAEEESVIDPVLLGMQLQSLESLDW